MRKTLWAIIIVLCLGSVSFGQQKPNNYLQEELLIASCNGNTEVVHSILESGENPNTCDKDKITALMLATSNGNLEIVKQLISKGADINDKDKFGNIALSYAIADHQNEVAIFLIDKGADINSFVYTDSKIIERWINDKEKEKSILMTIVLNGDTELLDYIIDKVKDVNQQNSNGLTPLMFAAMSRYTKPSTMYCVKQLIAHGANKYIKGNMGQTALSFAIQNNNEEITDLLK